MFASEAQIEIGELRRLVLKRIDLHIHTVRTVCDPQNYNFDLDILKEYVSKARLDAVAVTNHNLFDRENYDSVCDALDIPVFPGIEINVKTLGKYGHVLLIAPDDCLEDFAACAGMLAQLLPEKESSVTWEQVRSAFPDISKYLVIPHYRKDKHLDLPTIDKIRRTTGIDALEVANAKKWLKEEGSVDESFVIFSDCRPGLRMSSTDNGDSDKRRYAYGFTYIRCDEMSIPALKRAIAIRGNTTVFRDDDTFEILPEAIPVSTGLNIIVGNRTSGKTYTLDRIADAFEKSDVAYIGQFNITKQAEAGKFRELVAKEDAQFEDGYLKPLQAGLSDYFAFDIEGLEDKVRAYADAVIAFANSPEDDASSVPIYRAQLFAFDVDDRRALEDIKIRNAARKLLGDNERASIVSKYINVDVLLSLDVALRSEMLKDVKKRLAKERANEIVVSAKRRLNELSARRPLPDTAPLRDYFRTSFYEYGLGSILGELLRPVDLESEEAGRFVRKRKRTPVQSATEAKKRVTTQTSIAGLYKNTTTLDKLRFLRNVPDDLKLVAQRLLIRVESFIVDKGRGTPLSGGQRAEYVFVHELEKAKQKDIVLIDEPESSFDNGFLGSDISDALHRLADDATVFLVTHNNTLGVSINPDWVIYAAYEKGEYKLFSGAMSSSELVSSNGEKVLRREVLMNTMEAGWDAYEGRRLHYDLAPDKR